MILIVSALCKKNESEYHYLVVTSVAKCSDCHYILPQISLPCSDIHYSFITVTHTPLQLPELGKHTSSYMLAVLHALYMVSDSYLSRWSYQIPDSDSVCSDCIA